MSRARGAEWKRPRRNGTGCQKAFQTRLQDRSRSPAAEITRHGFHRQRRANSREKNSFPVIFAIRNARAEAPLFASGWKSTATKSRGCRRIYTSKEKVTRFSPATHFSAVTNSAPTSIRIAPSPTCLVCLVISVELVDPRFYHIDTCFCPLTDGGAMWFPAAFDEYGQRAIRDHVCKPDRCRGGGSGRFLAATRLCSIGTSSARRCAEAHRPLQRSRLYLSPAADDRIPESRRRLQMPDHAHAAAGECALTVKFWRLSVQR